MTSICNFVSAAIYNRLSQSPAIQKISTGMVCLRQGKSLLCDPDSSPPPSLIRKIGRTVAGIALIAKGIAGLYEGGNTLITSSAEQLKTAFLFGENPAPTVQQDPYEIAFQPQASHNQTEVLYLGVGNDTDYNGALSPTLTDSLSSRLNAISKLKYEVIRHPLQICDKIRSTSKKNLEDCLDFSDEDLVQDLILGAHGNGRSMDFSPTSEFKVFDELPANCFDGLSSKARIFLHSCSTGADSLWRPNIAQWISWISGREVIAPSDPILAGQEECFINPENGRLDIQLKGPKSKELNVFQIIFGPPLVNLSTHFNISSSWGEKAQFYTKMIPPTVFGAMATWQTMRLGATVLQGSGAAAEWIVDKSAAPIKSLAEKRGLYNPDAAQILYTATKGTCQILNATGKLIHRGMDKLIQPLNQLGSWGFNKCVSVATNVAKTLAGASAEAIIKYTGLCV